MGHLGKRKARQFCRRIFDAFDLKPEIGQGIENLIKGRLGLKVIFQPGKGEFHGDSPQLFLAAMS